MHQAIAAIAASCDITNMSILHDVRASWATLSSFALMGVLWSGFHSYAPQIKALTNASDWDFGLALFASAVGSLAAMALAPKFESLAGARTILAAGLILIVVFQALPLVSSFGSLISVMVLIGAGLGLMDVLMNAQVSRDEAASGRSLMNLNHGIYSLSYALAALIAATMRGAGIGLDMYYLSAGLFGVFVLWPVRRIRFHDPSGGKAARASGRLPALVFWGGLIVALGFACENAVESWSALHVERTLGGSAGQGPLGPASLGLTMAFGRLSGQFLVARFDETLIIRWGAVIAALGTLLAAMATVPWMAYLGFAGAGLGISILAPMALALIGRNVAPKLRTRAIARGAIIGYCGFFFGPPIVGSVAELGGLRMAFLVVAGVLLLITVVLKNFRKA